MFFTVILRQKVSFAPLRIESDYGWIAPAIQQKSDSIQGSESAIAHSTLHEETNFECGIGIADSIRDSCSHEGRPYVECGQLLQRLWAHVAN